MKNNCLICGYSEIKLGDARKLCHHPETPYTKVVTPEFKCPLEKQRREHN